MNIAINKDNELFKNLANNPPKWWDSLKKDPDIYIDIRKNNIINAYYNGGSIIRLEWRSKSYSAKILNKYVPLDYEKSYIPFHFDDNQISLKNLNIIPINNFDGNTLKKIKEKIKQYYPSNSEKEIQGRYVINSYKNAEKGIFIDTEFQFEKNLRIDMIWLDFETKSISFIELKTIGNPKLFNETKNSSESITGQLSKYEKFIGTNSSDLLTYYNEIFSIKKSLNIIPNNISNLSSIKDFKIIDKPILLIGNCSQEWIDNNTEIINNKIKQYAYACIYHGKTNFDFRFPRKSTKNVFVF